MKDYNYIYLITNNVNGKIYIGKHSTNKLDDDYMGSGLLVKKAIQKYGLENFTKDYLAFCDSKDTLNYLERFYIKKYKAKECGYNLTDGGDGGSMKGRHHSEETKQKLRKPKSEETKKKLSEAQKKYCKEHGNQNLGKHHIFGPMNEEHKKKIAAALKNNTNGRGNIGHHPSLETRQLWSKQRKGKTAWNKGETPKYKWLTTDGEIRIMDICNAKRYHKDWKLIEQV